MTGHETSSDELLHYLVVPLRRWRVVSLVLLVGVAASALYVLSSPKQYTATSLVELHQISTSPFDATKASNQLIDVATEAKTATSQVVAARAAELLSGHPSAAYLQKLVKVNAATGTTTLSIAFTAPTAAESAAGANAFANAYLDSRAMWADKRRQELIDTIDESLDGLRDQLTKVNKSVASADPASARAQDDLTTRTLLTQQFSDLTQRRNGLTGMSLDPGQVVSSALPGSADVTPNPKIYLLGGFLISLILGFAAALARNRLDRRVRSAAQLEELLEVGVTAAGPVHRATTGTTVPSDAMYVLRSRLLTGLPEPESLVLLVIDLSAGSSSGAVGIQLAHLMANAGAPVRPIILAGPDIREQYYGELLLFPRGIRPVWLQVSDPDDVREQQALHEEMKAARRERQTAVLIMVGAPRRSAVVANSTLADQVILVAQVGHTQIDTVRRTRQDVLESGANIFAGVLARPGRARRRRGAGGGNVVNAAHAAGGESGTAQRPPAPPATGWPGPGTPVPAAAYAPDSAPVVADHRSSTTTPPRPSAKPPTIPMSLRMKGNQPSGRPASSGAPATADSEKRAQ